MTRTRARTLGGMRWYAHLSTLVAIILSLAANAGCEPDQGLVNSKDAVSSGVDSSKVFEPVGRLVGTQSKTPSPTPSSTEPATQSASIKTAQGVMPARSPHTMLVGSFNIQAFGQSKMNDRWVMERLGEIIRQFDLIAIQEIRSTDQTILTVLMSYVNASGGNYEYVIGPRLGRTTSKEQYAFIYDSNRIMAAVNATYTLNDDIDALHREPFIGRFVTRTNLTNHPWSFSMVNLHTDPDVAVQEVNSMGGIMREIRNWEFASAQEDDCLLVGDFNAAPGKMEALQNIGGVLPLISNQPTNVRETELYDNILIEPNLTSEFTGRAGVMNLKDYFGIPIKDVLKLSDHNPVWAEFSIEERISQHPDPQQFAKQYGYTPR